MMREVNYDDAKIRLLDLMEAAVRGDKVFITKDGKLIVQLVPVKRGRHRKFGSARGKIKMSKDFDKPLADFREYMI